jgi:predicted methyltransferase/DNA-directed RNA polymerase subunit RPC12/RpoP
MDADAVAAEVAAAVGLAEGPAGVIDVLRVIAHHEPVATRDVARQAELPVPIVAAVCNELRKRAVVDAARPVRLTAAGRAVLAGIAGPAGAAALPAAGGVCPCCSGRGVVVPGQLAALATSLADMAARAPAAKLELDQTHCTVDTKLHRVLRMHESGALSGQRVVIVGDDDLISLALAGFAAAAGTGRPRRLAVIDSDPDLLGFIESRLRGLGMPAELAEHDLREPLPSSLTAGFDVACTDPPYTVAGAELFLSRAVAALAGGAGRHVFFSFGPRRPQELVQAQRLLADMGLAIRSLVPGFNSYTGAGILAGSSHLYHLRTTSGSRPTISGAYRGALYSAGNRAVATRPYRCASCGAVHQVGPGARWPGIAALKAEGCPRCGGKVLRPRPLTARHQARPAAPR